MGQTLPVMVELPSDALTTRKPGESLHRVQVIAAIHALAEWLAEHPDVPVPDSIDVISHLAGRYDSEADCLASLRKIAQLSETYDGKLHSRDGSVWVEAAVPVDADGARVLYTAFGQPAGDRSVDDILAAAGGTPHKSDYGVAPRADVSPTGDAQ